MANSVHRHSINAYLTLRAEWRSASNIEENFSDVTVDLYIDRGAYGYNTNSTADDTRIWIDGQEHRFTSNIGGGNNSSKLLGSSIKRVHHNEDGSKSIDIRVRKYVGVWWNGDLIGTRDYTFNVSLDNIPRASSINEVSGVIGSPVQITINRAVDSFTHTLRYSFAGFVGTIGTNITTSATWTPSMNLLNNMPNAVGGGGFIYVDTYNGSKLIGTRQFGVSLSVPESVVPTFDTITLVDSNKKADGLIPGNNFVKIISNIKATITNAKGAYGSKVILYKMEIVGKDNATNENGGLLGVMNYSGTFDVKGTVTDSRGRRFSKTVSINVLDYFSPVASFKARRIGADAQTLEIERTIKIAPLTVDGVQKNNVTVSFKRKLTTEADFVHVTGGNTVTDKHIITNFKESIGTDYLANKSYQIMMVVSDAFFSFETVTTVATERLIMHYTKDGVGIGKPRERGWLDVGGEIYAFDKPIQHHQLTRNDGRSLYKNGQDANSLNVNGDYYLTTATNVPGNENGYLTVVAHSDKYIYQRYMTAFSARSYERFCKNGVWTPWEKLAYVSTNWTSTGVSNVFYKTDGTTVQLRANVRSSAGGQNLRLGTVPRGLIPHEMQFNVPVWSLDSTLNKRLQVNTDGSVFIIQADANQEFKFNISWGV